MSRGLGRVVRSAPLCRGALLLAATVALSGCALVHRYDMTQIHANAAARTDRNPVIFIHGFIGSKLRNDHTSESVWGRFANAITRSQVDDLDLPIEASDFSSNRDHLVPYALYESVAGVKFYGAMMNALQDTGGYKMGDIREPHAGDTGFVYVYDWRRDNVEAAQGLAEAIHRVRTRLNAPEMRFDIVAHSMGGLVALYYLMYGGVDVVSDGLEHDVTWAGAPNLGRVVLVGTPLEGTMAAFRVLNTGFSRSMSPEAIFTMPSIYQLLPPPGTPMLVDPEGRPLDIDIYDAREWVKHRWSVFDGRGEGEERTGTPACDRIRETRVRFLQRALDRARHFRAALSRGGALDAPVPVHVFGSDCVPTLERALVKETGAGPVTLFNDESARDRSARRLEGLLLAPGDGTVTATSLLGVPAREGEPPTGGSGTATRARLASSFFVCETHGLLPGNAEFQDNLFHVLLQGPAPSALAPPQALKAERPTGK
jgi:pimeloyl-ACP methyl ester carboxylesterase